MWWWGSCAGYGCCSTVVSWNRTDLYEEERCVLPNNKGWREELGNSTKIFAARDKKTKEIVAVRLVPRKLLRKQGTRRRIRQEIKILSLCRQQANILQLYRVFDSWKKIELVFELASGGNVLNRRIECNTIGPWFSEREVSRIIGSVVSALSFLHQKKVIHGNVRPEHILYSDPGADSKVVLADFGRAGDISTFSLKNRTREGSLWEDVHELRFLPPFVVQQKQQTMKEWATAAQIDIWALGITCYILLCASFPFDGITLQEVERDILQKDLIFPNSGVVLSRAGKDLLSRILDRKSESSITNISELAAHPWINQNLASDATWDCDIVVKHQSFACSYLNKTSGLKRRMSSGVLSGMQLTDPTSSPELSEKPSYVSSDGVIVKGTSLPVTADGYMKQADAELLAAVDNDVRKRRDTDDAEIAVDLDILHTFYHQRRHNSVEENDLNP